MPSPRLEGRWESLDLVRGLTVAAMLLVNNPGTWDAVYPPLRHAAWHGWTPTDLIFPFFLFIVGITTELSLQKRSSAGAADGAVRRHIIARAGLIFAAGLLLHAFPFVPLTRITEVRIPGVLQRIGVCYLAAGLIAWRRSDRVVATVAGVLLLGYWAAMTLIAPPGQSHPTIDVPERTLAAYLDRLWLGGHLWSVSKTWDPEGPLSTVPAIGTVLLGVLTARAVGRAPSPRQRRQWLLLSGGAAIGLGLFWGHWFPINKNLWTSSYVIFTAGAAAVALALVGWLHEERGWRRLTTPLLSYGRNPLIAFLGSGVMARMMGSSVTVAGPNGPIPLQQAIYQTGFESWLDPINASLGYALAFVTLWFLILWWLERRAWFFRL